MTRRFKFLAMSCLALLSILGALLLGFLKVNVPTYAAHLSAEPQVVVAVDTTDHSCFKKTAKTLRALHTSAIKMPCPAGTVIQSVLVPLSVAKSDHETYVILPSSKASQSVWKQTNNQIDQLVVTKRNMIQHTSGRNKVHPDNDCGEYNEIGSYPTVFGDKLYVDTDYQISFSCNNLVLDQTQVFGFTSPNPVFFFQWLYASDGRQYEVPECRFTGTNHYTFPINDVDPLGYDFVWYFSYPFCISLQSTVSLGPLI